jgi:hypothetical protein
MVRESDASSTLVDGRLAGPSAAEPKLEATNRDLALRSVRPCRYRMAPCKPLSPVPAECATLMQRPFTQ